MEFQKWQFQDQTIVEKVLTLSNFLENIIETWQA
jgi:hypothetical protein